MFKIWSYRLAYPRFLLLRVQKPPTAHGIDFFPDYSRAPEKQKAGVDQSVIADALAAAYLGIMVLLPFHALLTTWAGSNFGHLDVWRIWKELLLFASSAGVFWLLARDKQLRRWAFGGWLAWLVLAYVGWGVFCGVMALLAGRVNGPALIYGLFADLRFPAFLMLVAVVAWTAPVMYVNWRRVIVGPLMLVVAFGLLQLALPADFLHHFGYGPDTIPTTQLVDNKQDYQRIQSTLRGANPLGAYLVVGISVTLAWLVYSRQKWLAALLLASGVALGVTYSRSAYLGAMAATGIVLWLLAAHGRLRKYVGIATVALVVVGVLVILLLRNNDAVQNVVFHSDEHSQSATSSNAERANNLQNGAGQVLRDPIGDGVGTAGPASMRNTEQQPRIAENYYIQIGQEMGWIGIGLFVALQVVLVRRLWPFRSRPLQAALIGSLVGITTVNMLSHAWADDTLGLLWWGLAGIALGGQMNDNHKSNNQQASRIKSHAKAAQSS